MISVSLFPRNTFSEDDKLCWSQTGYELYECRIEKICEPYESEKPTYTVTDYEKAENAKPKHHNQQSNAPALDAAKEIYRENIGNIYKCAMIQWQKNALSALKKNIKQEKSWELSDVIWEQIALRITRLELASNKIWCSLTDKKSIQNKLNVLSETTHEACRYVNYLEYIKFYYNQIDRFDDDQDHQNRTWWNAQNITRTYPIWELPRIINGVQNDIAEEISHTYKVFPIAFHAYSEYENNFPIHFLLEVVRADFIILREKLKAVLMPIAQTWLKVINAMSY